MTDPSTPFDLGWYVGLVIVLALTLGALEIYNRRETKRQQRDCLHYWPRHGRYCALCGMRKRRKP